MAKKSKVKKRQQQQRVRAAARAKKQQQQQQQLLLNNNKGEDESSESEGGGGGGGSSAAEILSSPAIAAVLVKKVEKMSLCENAKSRSSSNVSNVVAQLGRQPSGIGNMGNTCYFNSTMQVLAQTYILYHCLTERCAQSFVWNAKTFYQKTNSNNNRIYFASEQMQLKLDQPSTFITAFLQLQRDIFANKSTNPRSFLAEIRRHNSQFEGWAQQDAQELLISILDGLKKAEKMRQVRALIHGLQIENPKNATDEDKNKAQRFKLTSNHTIVDAIFGGQLVSSIHCTECNYRSFTFEQFFDLQLPLDLKATATTCKENDSMNIFSPYKFNKTINNYDNNNVKGKKGKGKGVRLNTDKVDEEDEVEEEEQLVEIENKQDSNENHSNRLTAKERKQKRASKKAAKREARKLARDKAQKQQQQQQTKLELQEEETQVQATMVINSDNDDDEDDDEDDDNDNDDENNDDNVDEKVDIKSEFSTDQDLNDEKPSSTIVEFTSVDNIFEFNRLDEYEKRIEFIIDDENFLENKKEDLLVVFEEEEEQEQQQQSTPNDQVDLTASVSEDALPLVQYEIEIETEPEPESTIVEEGGGGQKSVNCDNSLVVVEEKEKMIYSFNIGDKVPDSDSGCDSAVSNDDDCASILPPSSQSTEIVYGPHLPSIELHHLLSSSPEPSSNDKVPLQNGDQVEEAENDDDEEEESHSVDHKLFTDSDSGQEATNGSDDNVNNTISSTTGSSTQVDPIASTTECSGLLTHIHSEFRSKFYDLAQQRLAYNKSDFDNRDLGTLFENFIKPEVLDGVNKYLCDGCSKRNGNKKTYSKAIRQQMIALPPPVLVVHLKRFEASCFGRRGFASMSKLNTSVSFPEKLNISPYTSRLYQSFSKFYEPDYDPEVECNETQLEYSLYGVVIHSGGLRSGHYMAYVCVRPDRFQSDSNDNNLDSHHHQSLRRFLHLKPFVSNIEHILGVCYEQQQQKCQMDTTGGDEKHDQQQHDDDNVDDNQCNKLNEDESSCSDLPITTTTASSSTMCQQQQKQQSDHHHQPAQWYFISDSSVSPTNLTKVLNETSSPYLLFYERTC